MFINCFSVQLCTRKTVKNKIYGLGAHGSLPIIGRTASHAPAWFVSVMRLVTVGLDNIHTYLDTMGSDDCPINHVVTLANLLVRLRLHKLKLSPDKSRIGAARVDFLSHLILKDGAHPNDDQVAALSGMYMLTNTKQLRSPLGGLSYYRRFPPKNSSPYTPDLGPPQKRRYVRIHLRHGGHRSRPLAELTTRPILVFPDWDKVTATLAPLASEPLSSRNNAMAQHAPLSTSVE